MSYLPEKSVWEDGIYQLETSDPVLAGPDGIDNLQGKQLANRTAYLKKQVDDLVSGALTAEYADRLKTSRTLAMTGDGAWSVNFDGNGNVSAAMTLANTGVAAGNYGMVTVDAKGRITSGRQMAAADVPALDWSKIASGRPSTLDGYGIAIASQAEAEAGNDNSLAMTPLKVAQALNAIGLAGRAKNITTGSLQTIRPNGLYHVDAVGQVVDAPVKCNGMLLTHFLNDKWGNQVYWMWGGDTYEQRLENGIWKPWVKVLKSGRQSTLADYGITDAASKTELQAAISNVIAGAPGALDTLQELAAALDNDASFAANLTKKLAGKADKASTLAGYGIADAFPLRADIASAVDLDTLTITGIYHNPANDNAIKGKNWPCPQAGQLTVRATGEMVYHTYQAFADGGFWHRCRYQGRWTVWRQLADAATTQDGITAAAPPGQIAYFARDTPPPGWIICNGAQDVSRATYAALFAAIGERFGAGDGKTTFGVPDLRGEFIRGWDAGGGVDVAGRSFGSRQASQNLAHDHAIPTPAGNIAGQDTVLVDNGGAPLDLGARQASNELLGEWNGSGRYLRYATYSTGGNESRPRNVALLACIKV
ncbi:tail fiber protein [Chromobacterium sphagni]|uniref:Phage tail collar domain-containing protein n=1 Tax=Chromobacterium sphagni TaxID=1903179 RepID=A0ABX3CBK9_9NEIS|nr:tail fiber protein [Chromobacterium sphagni]OHX19501.1 hypothetical protein BI344_18110 [Chromobacterium sphagni]